MAPNQGSSPGSPRSDQNRQHLFPKSTSSSRALLFCRLCAAVRSRWKRTKNPLRPTFACCASLLQPRPDLDHSTAGSAGDGVRNRHMPDGNAKSRRTGAADSRVSDTNPFSTSSLSRHLPPGRFPQAAWPQSKKCADFVLKRGRTRSLACWFFMRASAPTAPTSRWIRIRHHRLNRGKPPR